MGKLKVLFVCTGNTCRSPMAEALAADIWAKEGIAADVYSAGIHAGGFMPASRNSINAMESMGLDISAHTSRSITPDLIQEMDLVLTMTEGHKEMLARMYKNDTGKFYSLAEFSGGAYDVDDPFGMGADTYLACARQIREMIEKCTERIKERDEGIATFDGDTSDAKRKAF